MSVSCAALMCHAPIVIPKIAGERATECARTTAAMREVARRLVAHEPEVLVLISPHTPREPRRFGLVRVDWLEGDFGRFGVPGLALRMRGAPDAAAAVADAAERRGLATWSPSGSGLDHGALVPMFFLAEAGYTGKVLLIALPYPDTGLEATMGQAIADAARTLGQRFAVLASGDMSHRLQPGAPAGFHPQAKRFDQSFVELLEAGKLAELGAPAHLPAELRELAAEDVVDSCTVAAAAVGFDARGHRVLSYEGPFGVGYCEAVLYDEKADAASVSVNDARAGSKAAANERPPLELLEVARAAIAAHLQGGRCIVPRLPAPFDRSRGVFVTLRDAKGGLRGCIGHLEPQHATLAEEVASCAVASAQHDTRFPRVEPHELDDLRIELSLLMAPEPVRSLAELDPARYGVIVSRGERRGVLLPEIDGVTSAAQQVGIAARKAGLEPDDQVDLQRFEVIKLREDDCEHDRADERRRMVDLQLRARGIHDQRVLRAMDAVPRHTFVPAARRRDAYEDGALAIDQGQTISQPFMVARACELAALEPTDRVLDVGTGSGYQAAVLAQLCARVVSIERIPELAEHARRTLAELGLRVEVVLGDGTRGHAPGAPYDAIVVAAGAPSVPEALLEQLAPGGRLVIPIGPFEQQELTVLRKLASGEIVRVAHDACRYVPLRGGGGWADADG